MKNIEIIDMIEMNTSELQETTGGWFGKGTEPIALLILYVTVVLVPKLLSI